jgi:hypothetical protein
MVTAIAGYTRRLLALQLKKQLLWHQLPLICALHEFQRSVSSSCFWPNRLSLAFTRHR